MIGILSILLLFSFILWFANMAYQSGRDSEQITIFHWFAYGLTGFIQVGLFFAGIGAAAFGRLLRQDPSIAEELSAQMEPLGFSIDAFNFNLIGFGLWVPALIGLLVLLPPVRRVLARVITIDANNIVHAIALSFATIIFPNLFVTLGIGLENLTAVVSEDLDAQSLFLTTWGQNLGFFIMGLIGVGLFSHRSWRDVLTRLKLTAISLREVGIGFGAGIALLIVLSIILAAAEAVGLGDPVVDALSEELYGPFFESIFGIITVGVAAAWGEETIFRGAIQPRFGRWLTAFLFAIVHGNYGLSVVTVGIFIVGYVLGVIRDRYSTTTAMVSHATFNSVQALLAWLSIQWL